MALLAPAPAARRLAQVQGRARGASREDGRAVEVALVRAGIHQQSAPPPCMVYGIPFMTLIAAVLLAALQDAPALEHFEKNVRPLLHASCVPCHGPEKQKGGLRLDSKAALLKGGDSGAVLD